MDIQEKMLKVLEDVGKFLHQGCQDTQEAQLLETLASDYKSDKDSISERAPNTCEWFFEDPRFQAWRDRKDSSLLWISAGPGCGKSVLSRALVDEKRVCTDLMTTSICYFFFKDGLAHRTKAADALSALLHQLFENNSALMPHGLASYRNYGRNLHTAFSELWELLTLSVKDLEAG